jgi:hypothetical protein
MRTDSDPDAGKALPDTPTLPRDIPPPRTWKYLINYVLLGSSALLTVMEMIQSGTWRRLLAPVILIGVAIANMATRQAAERKAPGAAPNGGPAKPGPN